MQNAEIKKYPKEIMIRLRGVLGLKESDESMDGFIMLRDKRENFKELLEWYGFIGYDKEIRILIETIWGVDLD